jgi:hypothetical protein
MNAEIKSTGIIGQFTVTVADIHTPAEQEFTLKQLRLKLSAESVTYTNISGYIKAKRYTLTKVTVRSIRSMKGRRLKILTVISI